MNVLHSTGAIAAGGQLFFATIGPDADGRMRLIKSRSGEMVLYERSQRSLKTFAAALLNHLDRRGVTSIAFAASAQKGEYMAHAYAYKIEAVLQLMPIPVRLYASSQVSQFVSRAGRPPGPDLERLGPKFAKLQTRAIRTAMLDLEISNRASNPGPPIAAGSRKRSSASRADDDQPLSHYDLVCGL